MWKMRIKLIHDWRKLAWKFWSIKLGAVGTTLTSLLILWPDSALYLWGAMPEEVKAMLPPQYVPMIGVVIFALSMFARLVKQQKLDPSTKEACDESTGEDTHF